MLSFPEPAAVPALQRATGFVGMRYEDIAQDGALKVLGMPHAIGMICFRDLWHDTEINQHTRPYGVLSILSRLIMESTGGPLSVRNAVEVEGQYALAHTRDPQGVVDRILLNMHADLFGPVATTHDPQPKNEGERAHVGRVFAEHVFTRPWGPPDRRKVRVLDLPAGPYVPEDAYQFRGALSTLDLPTGARWIEPELTLDAAPLVFGLTHTDSNQHVNSLVYPQLFEDAALRRLFDLGRSTSRLLVDHIDIAFRKPCFAGERMYLWLRSFELGSHLGAVGYLGPADSEPARAHCMCVLTLRTT